MMSDSPLSATPRRLASLDAYRGLIMLLMASGGFALARTLDRHPEIVTQYEGQSFDLLWQTLWDRLSYEFSHVEWTGCSLWDLIQPSFIFMVGVAMPFSYAKREFAGHSGLRMFAHAIVRSLVLILLAVFLSSNGSRQTNYIFTNVLAQIGLAYPFVYLLHRRNFVIQLLALAGILGGYWHYFYNYTIPQAEQDQVRTYLVEELELELNKQQELDQFSGLSAHWNKHTNAAAAFDRRFLSRYPREEEPWYGRTYWINRGGYQTLNFVPSIATMLLGVMAGILLRSGRSDDKKLLWLLIAGGLCFVTSMSIDTNIWPVKISGCDWSLCPIVKRIWTPSWAVFSAGWTFWMLAVLYWIIDKRGYKRWAFPLVVVGMNSIVMYCMSQLIKPWVGKSLKIHLTSLDMVLGWGDGGAHHWWENGISFYLFDDSYAYADIWQNTARVFVLWLICLWLYRRKIFVRI